jgi:hypothetical protein
MLVPFRHPVGIAVSALALLSFLGFVLASLSGEPVGVRGRDLKVERIRASSAPLVAADLAGFEERRRREGRGYARDTEALLSDWLTQFDREHRRQMREWTGYHGVRASATRTRFVIETMSAPMADGWYRLVVDRRARRVSATCGGDPAPGCAHGRWRIEDHGLVRRYLLGR